MPTPDSSWVDRVLGGDIPYLNYAVPFFFLLIGIEIVFSILAGKQVFRVNDSITDLACGIIDQTTKLIVEATVLLAYVYVYENYRIWEIADWSPAGKWGAALLCFFAVDFCFYWHHRFGHEFAAGWATHVVHHQSEDFNLIVALRQSAIEHHLTFFFYLPLAYLGIPVSWYVAMFAFNLIWQFWCHTRLIDKLGPLEWFFVTPSHHRVHHGRNLQYLDKNYGGTLIIWDKLFGTFEPEREEVVYGITKPIQSWNPLWANLHVWYDMACDAYQAPYLWDKVRIWFMPLGWTPRGLTPRPDPPYVDAKSAVLYETTLPGGLTAYALTHFAITMGVGLANLVSNGRHAHLAESWEQVLFIFASLLAVGGVLERRRWVLPLELVRLTQAPLVAWGRLSSLPAGSVWVGLAIVMSVLSAGWILAYRQSLTTSPGAAQARHPSPSPGHSLAR